MVKRIRTLLTLFLLLMGTSLSWADVTKCTWDFSDSSCPAGNAAFEGNGVKTGTVASDVEGVELFVDASEGKFNSKDRSSDIQINATTIIKIPVKTTKDEIAITNYPNSNYAIGYTIGDKTATAEDGFFKYTATSADVEDGYATMTVTSSGYAISIVVKQNSVETPGGVSLEERTATWDWKNGVPSTIGAATSFEGNSGEIDSDVDGIALDVDATTGKFKYNASGYVQFNSTTVLNVPVRSAGDVVKVVSYPGQYKYTVGGVAATGDETIYTATESDAAAGYVSVVATDGAYLYTISVKQIAVSAPSVGEEERVATWDFTKNFAQNDVNIQGSKGEVDSDVEGVSLDVDATNNGKLWSRGSDAQFNSGTILNVPVRSAGDIVTVVSFPGYHYYTIAGVAADEDTEKYTATESDAAAGYVSVVATGSAYLYTISVKQIAVSAPSVGEEERVATWDFTKNFAQNDVNIQGSKGEVDSDVEGVSLDVDATNNGKLWSRGSDAQFNSGTILKVPVRSAGDIVTVVSFPGYHYYTIAGVAATADTESYTATATDATTGYVSIIATGGAYLYTISVKQIATGSATPSVDEKERTATWDWQNGVPASIGTATSFEGNSGEIDSDIEGIALGVDAKTGKFKYNTSGYVQFNSSTVLKVPVRSAGDVVTVVSYPGQYKYTVGGVAATGDETMYTATEADATAGYVSVIATGTAYIYSISVYQIAIGSEAPENPDLIEVAANDASSLLKAIEKANKTGNKTIYLPNGTYDLGKTINTEIKAGNIAIIGESRDGVIIKNTPEVEGLGTTATLKNTSTGLYLQNITLQCTAPYSSTEKAERGVALWDHGTKTICKNVYLKGKQDTYYSNGAEGMIAYFEGGKIEGTVDFICGSGNVLFNSVTLNVTTSADLTSGGVIAAPSTYKSENGYVFANCKITAEGGQKGSYYLARGWQQSPAALFVGTILVNNPASTLWAHNISTLESRRFAAYRTQAVGFTDKSTNDSGTTSADKASLVEFAGSWDPAKIISQHNPIKTNAAGWASYTAFTDVYINGGAKPYIATGIGEASVILESVPNLPAGTAVFIKGEANSEYTVNGALVSKITKTNKIMPVIFDTTIAGGKNYYVLGTKDGKAGIFKVASSLAIPAGKAYLDASSTSFAKEELELVIAEEATAIRNVNSESGDDAVRYNLAGQKVGKNFKGIVVVNGKARLAK